MARVVVRCLATVGALVALVGASASGPASSAGSGRVHTALVPGDPYFAGWSWPATTSKLDAAWNVTLGSPTVTIAVVDTGVTPLGDLARALVPGVDLVDDSGNTADTNGHGTAVASVIAARTDNGIGIAGVCGGCTIMPVRVFDASGSASTATVAAGITWAVDHGADVVNLSLSGSRDSPVLDEAITYATGHEVTVVVAAGNGGSSDAVHDGYPAASSPTALRVAGVDRNGALFSWSNHGSWVDIAAPGSVAALLANGTVSLGVQGTSMAAPYVSGTVGLMLSVNSTLSPADVKRILLATGTATAGLDVSSGSRLDAYAALVGAGHAASATLAATGGGR